MIGTFQYHITLGKGLVQITTGILHMGTEIPLVVCADRIQGFPVILGMYKNFIVQRFVIIQNSRKYFIFHLDHFQGTVYTGFVLPGNDGYSISDKADMLIEDQTIVGTPFRIGLPGLGKAVCRHILPGIDGFDTRNLHGNINIDILDQGICMRTS